MGVLTVEEIFPAFAAELENLMVAAGRSDLAPQILGLPVLDRCDCGQGNCAHFYTEPKPTGSYGPGHSSVLLPAKSGLIVCDVIDGRIAAIEVLDRPDVKAVIDEYLGSTGQPADWRP